MCSDNLNQHRVAFFFSSQCFQTHDKVYIILELVSGGELFDRIKEAKKLDEDRARYYFQQIILISRLLIAGMQTSQSL